MLERTNNPEILEGARLLEISCIRMAEYLKYSIFRGKTPDLTNRGIGLDLLSEKYINLRARFCNIRILLSFELVACPHAVSP